MEDVEKLSKYDLCHADNNERMNQGLLLLDDDYERETGEYQLYRIDFNFTVCGYDPDEMLPKKYSTDARRL